MQLLHRQLVKMILSLIHLWHNTIHQFLVNSCKMCCWWAPSPIVTSSSATWKFRASSSTARKSVNCSAHLIMFVSNCHHFFIYSWNSLLLAVFYAHHLKLYQNLLEDWWWAYLFYDLLALFYVIDLLVVFLCLAPEILHYEPITLSADIW